MGRPKCVIDRKILNESTIDNVDDLGLSFFAKLCGNNRGVFVIDPPDGKTYGCGSLPQSFSTDAGISSDDAVLLSDSVSLIKAYVGGNVTSTQTLHVLNSYVNAVYSSTESNDDMPYACDVGGLATLVDCDESSGGGGRRKGRGLLPNGDDVVRSVTLAGAFVHEPWMSSVPLTTREALEFYTSNDFRDMAEMGVNAVRIPVPTYAFVNDVDNGEEIVSAVTKMLDRAERAGLYAIIALVDDTAAAVGGGGGGGTRDALLEEEHAGVGEAASFASSYDDVVIALELPSYSSVVIARSRASAGLPLLVPTDKGKIGGVRRPPTFADDDDGDDNVFAALDLGAHASVANVASSDGLSDRMKMFYHESLACMDRSPIEWLDCYRGMSVYVSGFDLSVDDCHRVGEAGFKDYGQCDRFNETIDSGWWERHRRSLASRQLYSYSLGLGWSYTAWKLYGDDGSDPTTIDSPSKLLCLRDVIGAGLMPPLTTGRNGGSACLNGPENDVVMGDATLSPTPSPPPDCGYGWWNFTSSQCDYWVPPPPTPAPTVASAPTDYSSVTMGAVGGAIAALFLSWAAKKMTGRTAEGYSPLP